MVQQTKFDLDAETLKLDYDALVSVAQIAFVYTRERLSRRVEEDFRKVHGIPTSTDAEFLLRDAENLARSTTALHYLTEGRDREEKVIVLEGGPHA